MRNALPTFSLTLAVSLCAIAHADAQTSSLYVRESSEPAPQRTVPVRNGVPDRLSPAIAAVSFAAAPLPEPRVFAVNDLVTIIVRDSTENDSRAELETEKETTIEGEISDFPNLTLKDLLNFQLKPSKFSDGKPRVGVEMSKEFEGDGRYNRRDTFTTRITARIIDVKPNGVLVLEARKHVRTDKEELSMIITGACRGDDVASDNTVLSTALADLRIAKEHKGELRNATKKGVLTQVLEGLFAF